MAYRRIQQPWRNWDTVSLRRSVGLYLHIPFCLARCRYCDFLTYGRQRPDGLDPASYADLLSDEIRQRGAWFAGTYGKHGRRVGSIFIGGGTPTFLRPDKLCSMVRLLRSEFSIEHGAEITVEANPETLNVDYLSALHDAGVNRLSVGVQALQDRHLAFLTRTHRRSVVMRALQLVQDSPFEDYSFDVIYGVPGLTHTDLRETVSTLLQFNPEHISAYELTIEPCTPLAAWARQFPAQVVGQEEIAAQQDRLQRMLARHGLYRYEVSNYARPGRESRHNLRYWLGGDYLGLGLGASSRIGSEVVLNQKEIAEYRDSLKAVREAGDPHGIQFASLDEADRTMAPAADAFLTARTRLGFMDPARQINPDWLARGFVRFTDGMPELTSRGLDFSDLFARELS